MNQVTTTCPHCSTVFRVNPAQLAGRQGLVKCGRCGTVFNGYETVAGSAISPTRIEPLQQEAASPKPSRPLLWTVILSLGFLLFVIGIIASRHWMVSVWPESRETLKALYAPMGLHVQLPAKLDGWVIESSDMREDPSDPSEVWLIATLRNRASYEQAFPWLDLALLDADGTPLEVRRIPPKEYFGKKIDPDLGLGPNLEINIKLMLKRGQLKESGYRLVLFYPRS